MKTESIVLELIYKRTKMYVNIRLWETLNLIKRVKKNIMAVFILR